MLLEWTKKGIVGRGVLIDFYSYAQENNLNYDPWSYHKISVADIKKIARQHSIEFQTGDILLLRTGMKQPNNCYLPPKINTHTK